MKFDPFAYMAWAKALEVRQGLHLSCSGMPHLGPGDLGLSGPVRLKPRSPYGSEDLSAAIAARYGAKPGQVFLTSGSSLANYIAMALILEPGDEVVVEHPTYEALIRIPALFGAGVSRWKRTFGGGWSPDFKALGKAVTAKTRLIALTNPHNPSGIAFKPEDMDRLRSFTEDRGVTALVDEVYIDMVEGPSGASAFGRGGRIIATNSLTKSFGLGGLRIGWALAPEEFVAGMNSFQDLLSVQNPEPTLDIAERAFARIDDLARRTRAVLAGNLGLVESFVESEGLEWVKPDAGFCFPRLATSALCSSFCGTLAEKHGTFVVPGGNFDGCGRHFRLGFGLPSGQVARGLANAAEALRALPHA